MSRSCWRIEASLWESITLYNKQSSANNLSGDVILLVISLIYSRNIRGPSTVPCGTPDETFTEVDDSPFRSTHCVRSVSHVLIQFRILFVMP